MDPNGPTGRASVRVRAVLSDPNDVACLPVGRAYVIHAGKAACVQVLPPGDAPDVSPARYLELDEPSRDPAWWVETTWRPDRE